MHVTALSWTSEDFFFMSAACATRLPHPRTGRAVAVGPRLLIRQGNPAYFTAGGSSYSSSPKYSQKLNLTLTCTTHRNARAHPIGLY